MNNADEIKRRLQSVAILSVRAQEAMDKNDITAEELGDQLYDIEQDLKRAAALVEANIQ